MFEGDVCEYYTEVLECINHKTVRGGVVGFSWWFGHLERIENPMINRVYKLRWKEG